MKKKLKITESQYKKLKESLIEGEFSAQNSAKEGVIKEVETTFNKAYDYLDDAGVFNNNEELIKFIGELMIKTVNDSVEYHLSDGMTHDQFRGERHGY